MLNKDDSKISILIVPYTDRVKRVLISKRLLKIGLSIFSIFIIFSSLYLGRLYLNNLNSKRESKEIREIINKLEEDNKNKDRKLAQLRRENQELENQSSQIKEKLGEIDRLQRKVEKMTGTKPPSRGGNISRNKDIDLSSLQSQEKLELVTDLLDDKQLELEVFIEKLGQRLDYLDSLPDLMPTKGRLTSKYGRRRDPFTGGIRLHQGIDIANSPGTIIKAAGKGRVVFSGIKKGLGQLIIIDHGNSYKSLYAHNSKLLVEEGEYVDKGQEIAKMGSTGRSTGCHLHFEIHKNGQTTDPLDIIKD